MTMIQATTGVVLARAIQGVLRGEKLGEAEHQCAGVLLLAGGAHVPTGRLFSEVVAEVEAANSDEAYIRQAMQHIMAGVQVQEFQAPRGPVSPSNPAGLDTETGLFPLPGGGPSGKPVADDGLN